MTTADPEELWRRLYRPGAGRGDVAAYLEATREDRAPEPLPAAPGERPGRPRRRLEVVGVVGGVVALVALLGVVRTAGGAQEAAPAAAFSAAPAPTLASLPTVSVDRASRYVFIRNLLSGRDAGLVAWVTSQGYAASIPDDRVVEAHGTGDGVVALPRGAASEDGRLVVLLVTARDGVAAWSSARLMSQDGRPERLAAVSTRSGALRAGVPTYGRVDFGRRERPIRVLVEVPPGTTWGLAAVVRP